MKAAKTFVAELTAAGYRLDVRSCRQASDATVQYRWDHKDGSYYVVTELLDALVMGPTVKSWYYRGPGGDAKSDKWFKNWPEEPGNALAEHAKKNKKAAPRTPHFRRTQEQIKRANFVLYD